MEVEVSVLQIKTQCKLSAGTMAHTSITCNVYPWGLIYEQPIWYFSVECNYSHDDVITWRHFPHYWLFVRGIHRSPVNSPHKGQWCGALMFSLICALNKWLSKQSWDWWFETPSRSWRRHCDWSVGIDKYFVVKLSYEMLPVHRQQHLFSTPERMFLWQCGRLWDRKCLDLRETRTPTFGFMPSGLTIWAIKAIHLLVPYLEYLLLCI